MEAITDSEVAKHILAEARCAGRPLDKDTLRALVNLRLAIVHLLATRTLIQKGRLLVVGFEGSEAVLKLSDAAPRQQGGLVRSN